MCDPADTIDDNILWKLGSLTCTDEEAAAWFDLPLDTMQRILSLEPHKSAWEAGQQHGRESLRRLNLHARGRTSLRLLRPRSEESA